MFRRLRACSYVLRVLLQESGLLQRFHKIPDQSEGVVHWRKWWRYLDRALRSSLRLFDSHVFALGNGKRVKRPLMHAPGIHLHFKRNVALSIVDILSGILKH